MNTYQHQPVLLQESLDGLAIKPDGIYIDGTFGRGGHSCAILNRLSSHGRLIAVDKDSEAITYAKEYLGHDPRFSIYQGSFANLKSFAKDANVYGKVDGILLDLGVSSPQLDNPARGFSFMQPGPLDMRMDLNQSFDAAAFINQAGFDELANVFHEYGEERFARRIARAIISARLETPILTTEALSEIVKVANPKWEKHKHPATRIFQAIRIHVNQELIDLTTCLETSLEILTVGGRLAVISFHSLEDRIVKRFMRTKEEGIQLPREIPLRHSEKNVCFKRIVKTLKASDHEIQQNIRARSAVLRIGEKIA